VTEAQLPDLVVGLIRVRDAEGRSADEGAEIVPHVAELIAIVHNQGDAQADETALQTFLERAASWAANATPTRSRRASAILSQTPTVRLSAASRQPGWQMCFGSLCGTESGVGMTTRSPL